MKARKRNTSFNSFTLLEAQPRECKQTSDKILVSALRHLDKKGFSEVLKDD